VFQQKERYVKPKRPLDISINLNVRGMQPSSTLEINERSNRLIQEGREIFKFGLGQSPFPVPETVVEALRANAFQKDYLPVKGLRPLRDSVAEYLYRTQNLTRDGDDVLVGPGSKELMFLLQLVYYGDLVIPRPSWVSYAPQASIIGRRVIWVPTKKENDWHLTPEELTQICEGDPNKPRIVILNYPSNPTGRTYRLEELKKLAKVARAHRVVLLSDEIYGELHHKGQHISIARFYPEGTIISGGLSKWCGAGGWRLGVFTFPTELRWLLDAIAAVASETYTSTSAPIQYAAVKAYQGGEEIDEYLQLCRRVLRALGRYCVSRLESFGIGVAAPKGAFYLFLDFSAYAAELKQRGIETSGQLCQQLLENRGVALLPGTDFGLSKNEYATRLSYVDFDGARALRAAADYTQNQPLNGQFLQEYCPRVVRGVELIGEWLTSTVSHNER